MFICSPFIDFVDFCCLDSPLIDFLERFLEMTFVSILCEFFDNY
ncbi:hypothetical protein HFN_1499 [Helicobacter fennelliae MRY12-0050]|uniref:Uncharacterized protein n=1 Tax=Helicobacter fennelliae MRY12-0050 TaxID=1325130 RepID=T1CVX5_9HELI|nr:hypothetical protein HFN_1499 [Helicobacter fennelliae MRY12-0050]